MLVPLTPVFSRAAYTSILEKIVWIKASHCLCLQYMENHEIHGELSPNIQLFVTSNMHTLKDKYFTLVMRTNSCSLEYTKETPLVLTSQRFATVNISSNVDTQ